MNKYDKILKSLSEEEKEKIYQGIIIINKYYHFSLSEEKEIEIYDFKNERYLPH